MKKSLYRKLSRMARDGDQEAIEAVAEILETITEDPELTAGVAEEIPAAPVTVAPDPANIVVGYPAGGGVPAVAAPAVVPVVAPAAVPVAGSPVMDPTAVVTVPEGHEVTIDSDLGVAILEKLDQLIALLTPQGTDEDPEGEGETGEHPEDPIEEIVEAVAEAVEAGAAAEGTEETESAEMDPAAVVAQALETMLEPSTVLEPEEEEGLTDCDDPECNRNEATADALRAAMKAFRPALAKLPEKDRKKVCADVAARIRKSNAKKKRAGSAGVYAALARGRDRKADEGNALGKRIMATRNANLKK